MYQQIRDVIIAFSCGREHSITLMRELSLGSPCKKATNICVAPPQQGIGERSVKGWSSRNRRQVLLTAFGRNIDKLSFRKAFRCQQDGSGNGCVFVKGETTEHLRWSRLQLGKGHAELRECSSVDRLHQPENDVVKKIELMRAETVCARKQQPGHLSEQVSMAVRGAAPDGAFNLGNELGRRYGSHAAHQFCSAGISLFPEPIARLNR